MQIQIPGTTFALDGMSPVVILGANGSGKTRLAVDMTRSGNGEFIPAVRNIALPDQIPNWNLQTATSELTSRTAQRRNSHWELIQDIDALFGKLWSSHAVEAMRVYDIIREGKTPTLPSTVLDKTRELWKTVFPGRTITFSDFSARVSNDYMGSSSYTAKHMSDGERTGLYLAARILDSAHGFVVVDEPETHFHSRLAVRFWDAMEALCGEKRFVYVTHDLNFALSRKDAQIILTRPDKSPELVQAGSHLPPEDVASILGAASFSVYAKRIVFCEGQEKKSLDQELLRAWFEERETAVMPVGSCENVKRCTAAFQPGSIVSGFEAIGIIDRDHWPEDLLSNLNPQLHVLRVHEVEHLYVLKDVFRAVAMHTAHPEDKVDSLYSKAFEEFKRRSRGMIANKLIRERFRASSMMVFERGFSTTSDTSDRATLRASMTRKMESVPSAEELWDREEKVVDDALNSDDPLAFLRVIPGKNGIIEAAAKILGIREERYCELIRVALTSREESMAPMRKALEEALSPHLPERRS
jgi:ABC-type cobalamin/Fe3+-siderophores transport system ATPase subunit